MFWVCFMTSKLLQFCWTIVMTELKSSHLSWIGQKLEGGGGLVLFLFRGGHWAGRYPEPQYRRNTVKYRSTASKITWIPKLLEWIKQNTVPKLQNDRNTARKTPQYRNTENPNFPLFLPCVLYTLPQSAARKTITLPLCDAQNLWHMYMCICVYVVVGTWIQNRTEMCTGPPPVYIDMH